MEIKFDVYFKKNLGTLFKHNEVDLDGVPAHINLQLDLVDRLEVNYKINEDKYTDEIIKINPSESLIYIPFKSDVVKKGLNEFEVVAYMKNGDVKVSQTYTYSIEEGIGEGIQILEHTHSNLIILESITQSKILEWDNKVNTEDLSDYYTKSEIDNIVGDIDKILDMINGEVV